MKRMWILLVLLATACSAAPATKSQSEIDTAVALTIAAKEPKITNTSKPTDTLPPTITNTPLPTHTPKPTNTPLPTNTTRPTKTKTPVPTRTPVPEPIYLSGSGDSVIDVEKWDGAAIMKISYTGSGNFVVINYDQNNEKLDLLVNEIGNYQGTILIDEMDDENTVRFEIKANAEWQFEIYPLYRDYLRIEKVPGIYQGVGDDVIVLDTSQNKPDTLIAEATGKSNFVIWGYTKSDRDLLINEIAPYSGTVIISRDTILLVITATGPWTIEITSK